MPCNSGPSCEDERRELLEREAVTRFCCAQLKDMEDRGEPLPRDPDLAGWWARHKAHDQARERAEAEARCRADARRAAWNKLTPEERAAAGLTRP